MSAEGQAEVVQQDTGCHDAARFIQKQRGGFLQHFGIGEIGRPRPCAERRVMGHDWIFVFRCSEALLKMEHLLQDGEHRSQEACHGAPQHEEVFVEAVEHRENSCGLSGDPSVS